MIEKYTHIQTSIELEGSILPDAGPRIVQAIEKSDWATLAERSLWWEICEPPRLGD